MAEGLSVRALGLGQACAALVDDANSVHVNPAGLARAEGVSLGGGLILGILEDRSSYLNGAWRVNPDVGLGLQGAFASAEDMARDPYGNDLGTFSARQSLLGLSAGFSVSPGLRLGLGLKASNDELAGQSAATAFAGDAGLQYDHGRWTAALAVLNAGSASAGGQSLPTPLRVQAGFAMSLFSPRWKVEAGVQGLPFEQQARFLLGSELGFSLRDAGAPELEHSTLPAPDRVQLRAGLQAGFMQKEEARVSAGAGLGFGGRGQLDYALQDLGVLGQTHRFSLSLHFESRPLRAGAAAQAPAADLSAPYGLAVAVRDGGLVVSWQHEGEAPRGYNLYSDYGVLLERLNEEPLSGTTQRFVRVTRSRTYNFYVRPVGADGQEGPPSPVKTVRVR